MKPKHKQFLKELVGNMATIGGCPVPTTQPCWMSNNYNQFEWSRKKEFPWLKATKRMK